MYYTCKYGSPLGGITLASDGENLTGLWFDGQKYFADNLPEQYEEQDLPVFAQAKRWLDIYFSGREPDFTPPLSLTGISSFRRRVWGIMLTIPYGRTSTYGEIAAQIAAETGKRVSAQAVAGRSATTVYRSSFPATALSAQAAALQGMRAASIKRSLF